MAGEEDQLQQLMAVTGLEDPDAARYYLEMAEHDCNAAALLFFEQQADHEQQQQQQSASRSSSSCSSSSSGGRSRGGSSSSSIGKCGAQEKQTRSREQKKRANDNEAAEESRYSSNSSSGNSSRSSSARRSGRRRPREDRSSSSNSKSTDAVHVSASSDGEERELRTPDPAYSLRLLSAGPAYSTLRGGFAAGGPGEDSFAAELAATSLPSSLTAPADAGGSAAFAGLYQPPQEIVCRLPFAKAKELCTRTQRWLLVNVQKGDEFESHKLNRDIWRAEIVQDLIKEFFVFWQRPQSDHEGKVFCDLYKVVSFPHIAVIDPQTGRSLKQWNSRRFLDPVGAQSELFEFIESEQQKQEAKAAAAAAATASAEVLSSAAAPSAAMSRQVPDATAPPASAPATADSAAAAAAASLRRSAAASTSAKQETTSAEAHAESQATSSSSSSGSGSGGGSSNGIRSSDSSSSDRTSSSASGDADCSALPDLQLLREKRLRALEKRTSPQ